MTTPIPAQRQLRFGYFLVPLAADPLIATAQRVERLGLDYVGIQDHPYQRRFVDTWSLMAMIAASTATLRAFPDVANLPLRPPAVMAKAAATIDLLSGGRFELGLGAGGFWDAIAAYGGPRRSPRDVSRRAAAAATISSIRAASSASVIGGRGASVSGAGGSTAARPGGRERSSD